MTPKAMSGARSANPSASQRRSACEVPASMRRPGADHRYERAGPRSRPGAARIAERGYPWRERAEAIAARQPALRRYLPADPPRPAAHLDVAGQGAVTHAELVAKTGDPTTSATHPRGAYTGAPRRTESARAAADAGKPSHAADRGDALTAAPVWPRRARRSTPNSRWLHVDDPLEHEADRVADHVMRMPALGISSVTPPQVDRKCVGARPTRRAPRAPPRTPFSRKCAACDEEDRFTGSRPHRSATARRLRSLTKCFSRRDDRWTPRRGRSSNPVSVIDFSAVRVHTDAIAESSASPVNVHAYTVGHHVVFGAGRMPPETNDGQRLIAHSSATCPAIVARAGRPWPHRGGAQARRSRCRASCHTDDEPRGRERADRAGGIR